MRNNNLYFKQENKQSNFADQTNVFCVPINSKNSFFDEQQNNKYSILDLYLRVNMDCHFYFILPIYFYLLYFKEPVWCSG